jgi:hypothetical protein
MSQSSVTLLDYLNSLRPALPLSVRAKRDERGGFKLMSNGELRQHAREGAILINGETFDISEPLDFPVFSLVFFPASKKRRTTLL